MTAQGLFGSSGSERGSCERTNKAGANAVAANEQTNNK
jgi:hypothetical protein